MTKRYRRHGSAVELDGLVMHHKGYRVSELTGETISGMYRQWTVRIAGRVVDRALTMRRARALAEHHARAALIA